MNKKQLAKLLIKHPEIKALYESREFDASIINKIVAEEIMREGEDEEGEGRVSQADKQTRAALDAEDSDLEPVNCATDDIDCLKGEINSATTMKELEELADEVEPKNRMHVGLVRALKAAKARIEGVGSEAPPAEEEDSAKKEMIQSMKSEIQFLKSLLNDPETMPLDKEEYKEAIDEYTKKLEAMGVKVARTDSTEDDKAFVQSIQDEKPKIKQAADAVKAAEEDDFAQKFSDLDAAIMASLKGSKDAATAANDELDLSDIEIDDGSNDSSKDSTQTLSAQGSAGIPMKAMELIVKDVSKKATIENFPILLSDKEFVEKLLSLPQILGSNSLPNSFFGPDKQTGDIGGMKENSESNNGVALMREIDSFVELLKNPTDKDYKISGLKIFEKLLFTDKIKSTLDTASGEEAIQIKQSQIDKLSDSLGPLNDKSFLEKLKMDLERIKQRTQSEELTNDSIDAPATEEGTAAAIEAIENEVPDELENITQADVEAAEEELEPEIEKDPQKQANAEELKNQVENKKMADKSKAVSSWASFKNSLKQSNVESKKQVLDVEVNKRLEIYSNARDWEGLTVDPLNHEISKDASAESFEKWKKEALPEIEDYFNGVLVRSAKAKPEELDVIAGDIESKIGTIDDAMNNDATGETSDGDSSGAEVTGATDLETIKEILPELKDKLPNLFKFDEFVKNLAKALLAAKPSLDSDGEEEVGDDVDGSFKSSDINIDSNKANNSVSPNADSAGVMPESLGESLSGIYLTEEGEVIDTQVDNTADDTSGQPLDVADATVLQAELEELRKFLAPKEINVEDLLTQDLKDALAGAPKTDVEAEPKTAEQAAVDGKTASGIDARKEQASAIAIYSTLIQPMDDFFSTDQAQRLGFMEQFLLESQSKMLWALIGNLTLIAEKGEAKALTNRAEKETAGMSGDAAPEAEVEPTAEPEVQAEAKFNPFKRDKEPVEISKEDQISLKTDLKALLQTLRATKSMIKSYETNMTKVSVDPGLDGSALKEQLDQYLPMVQKSIAKIVERANEAFVKATELNAPKEEPESSQPADDAPPSPTTDANSETTQEGMINAIFEAMQPALHEMSLMQEDSRDETINRVDSVYKDMRLIYAPVGGGEDSEGLRGFMETGDRARTIQQAEKMLELATKEDFIKLFPGGRIGEGGMPATVNAATETMNREIKKLVLIMRDVVTLASKSVIPHSKLVEIVNSLTTISKSLYNSFGAKMMISGESLAQIETRLGEDEGNKSLTDQETKPGMMDKLGNLAGKAGELAGKGLEKLKQMFSWMNEEALKLLAKLIDAPDLARDPMFIKFVEPFGELVIKQGGELTAKSEGSPEVKQVEELMVKTLESKSWFDSLKPEQQSAVTEMINVLYTKRNLLQEMEMGIVPSEVKDKISPDYQMAMVLALKGMSDDQKQVITSLMQSDADDFVSYLVNQHELRRKMGEEKTKAIGELTLKTSGPLSPKGTDSASADVEFDDEGEDDPNAEDEMPEPENLGKDDSELEDVDGFDDSKEEPDVSGSPEDEDDVEDFKREVKSLDSFLPLVQKPSDPIAKKIQPIKDSFAATLAKKKILQGPRAKALFNKFFLLIFKQMNKDLVMEDAERFAKTLIPKIKQDMKKFVTSLGSDELKPRDFNFFFNNIKEVDLTNLIAIIRKHKAQIAKIVYGEKGQVSQDNSEKAVRGKEVNLEESLRPKEPSWQKKT
jgi:hypothetical protein